ncbi:MAG: hypothetical protein OXI43_09825 [Candidatus Poribacteria bacterium]|nr:hypothetical protein [Candidatus Poribacteria bacterium]
MILIEERFFSADHIQHISVESINDEHYSVTINMTGYSTKLGFGIDYVLSKEMAFELRRRIVKAIADYKSGDTPSVQTVDIPTYQEVHPEAENEKS